MTVRIKGESKYEAQSLVFGKALHLKNSRRFPTSRCLQFSGAACVCVCALSRFSHVRFFETPWTIAPRLLCPWDSPGKKTGVGCHFLLQGIFPTQDGTRISFVPCLLAGGFFTTSSTWGALSGADTTITLSSGNSSRSRCGPDSIPSSGDDRVRATLGVTEQSQRKY